MIGLGERNGVEYENIGESRVIDKISEKIPVVKVYRLYENYSVPIIEPLTEADLLPETVNIGWNNIGGEWHYYHTTESTSMAKMNGFHAGTKIRRRSGSMKMENGRK